MAAGADHQDRAARRARAGARWLIDGMNLIGSRPDRWWNDPDRAVRRLIHELDRYAAATGEDVTVVFDRGPRTSKPGGHGAAVVALPPGPGGTPPTTRSSASWRRTRRRARSRW
jgi:hypothetical protein